MTLDDIKVRCEEEGDCWIWQGGCGNAGYPTVKMKGVKSPVLVRRLVVDLVGRPAKPRQPVVASCGERLCCNPEHLRLSNWSSVGKVAAKKGAFSTLSRRAKISAGIRAKGTKLTAQQAQEIRASDLSTRVIAKQYGINRTGVQRIKQGETWVDFSSPFVALENRVALQIRGRSHA